MHQFLSLVYQVMLIYALHLCCCEGTSISLSPLGIVSVCPGGQVLLTCEITAGFFLHWTVSVPHLAITRDSIVAAQGALSTTDLQFNRLHFTEFHITRTSGSPLISQMLVNNATTEINGSTIYCSEDDDETGAPMVTVNVTNKDDALNVSLVNQLLRNNNVTVTLQWPREAGAVYHVNILSETSHTKLTNAISHNLSIMITLTISYDIQYNVSIVSSLCGVTRNKVLKYVTCDLPTQLSHGSVVVITGSQDCPLVEGQFITHTCPPGLILTGPNASVCMGNREWEPDPGQLECKADCGVPLVDSSYVKLNYSSTLDSSVLILICENEMFNMNTTDEQIFHVTCHSNGSWIPDPADFIKSCSSSTTVPPEMSSRTPVVQNETANLITVFSSIIIIVCAMSSIVFLSIGYTCGRFGHKHKQSRTSKATSDPAEKNAGRDEQSQLSQTPGPLYEELQLKSSPEYQDLVELKENVAYGPIAK